MKESIKLSWKQAFKSSPGPNNLKEAVFLFLKGLCMGSADIIPGVSGGTIAFITGIYAKLINAIKSINHEFFISILKFDFKKATSIIHIRFILSLFLGIGIALVSLAKLMNYLLEYQPVLTWSFFFGLIFASILIIGTNIKNWLGGGGIGFIIGIIFGWSIVSLVPVATPEAWWFIIFSGAVAICAMILPGISGAFILLILGKYEFITAAIKDPLALDNIFIIVLFLIGCAIGIVSFSHILSILLKKYNNLTIAILTGLMFGSLKKVWPWKEVIETKLIRGEPHVLKEANIFPEINSALFLPIILALAGFIAVITIKYLSTKNKTNISAH